MGTPLRRGVFYSEEGNQAATFPRGEGGHLVSPERIRNKIRSRRAAKPAKQADFMSKRGRKEPHPPLWDITPGGEGGHLHFQEKKGKLNKTIY